MSTNNPYASNQHQTGSDDSVLVPPRTDKSDTNPAADLIRQKLAAIYGDEPNAQQEMAEAELPGVHHSRYQRYMSSLHASGKSASEIQTAWHQYYSQLDDIEKRAVWQEFYEQSAQAKQQASRIQPHYLYQPEEPLRAPASAAATAAPLAASSPTQTQNDYPSPFEKAAYGVPTDKLKIPSPSPASPLQPQTQQPQRGLNASLSPLNPLGTALAPGTTPLVSSSPQDVTLLDIEDRPPAVIRQQLRDKINSRRGLKVKHHVQSLLFGLGFGALTLVIVLFGFFNEVVIAPFIQPSRNVSATPIIISPDGVTATDKNEVIIPKINVEIPLDFSATSIDEKEFEAALDKGVAHYPTTARPGQQGNASFFGHSSNNIFNPGKYKFAFVLLNELVPGDTFYITYDGVAYGYTVFDKKIVSATEVSILNPVAGRASTAMLVTCDPPGTSLNRLAIWGEQISPNPSSNTVAATPVPTTADKSSDALPGNGPTLWGRIRNWITSN